MFSKNIIQKLKDIGLTGKGGAGFPVWQKWQAVKNAKEKNKYIICNASEGEPMVFKDRYILENYPEEVINGIKIALETFSDNSDVAAYIYLNPAYYQQFKEKLTTLIADLPITLFEKPHSYIAGEETSLLNVIEGKGAEPRLKPPYPTEAGLWGKPTLIQNVETLYWVNKIAKNEYKGNRFYCIAGEVKSPGVFELPETYTIEQILRATANYQPQTTNYFYQVGGGAVGTIMLPNELNQPIKGTASIIIYNKEKTDPWGLMRTWAEFFVKNNCDKCTPCREGLYRIFEIISQGKETLRQAQGKLYEIFAALEKTSFCPLGRMAAVPFKSALEKLL